MKPPAFRLFERFGVELEYMIVDARTLDVRPQADRLIKRVAGDFNGDVSRGRLVWSNELALHMIEFKTGRPARTLDGLAKSFQAEVKFVNALLAAENAMLLPTAMHPWMDPHRESRLWPHDCGEIYAMFHRIFDCRGHGWTNLQATHLNLPFCGDDEFARLHTAIRLILPLLPALAASSPFADGQRAPFLDMRLETYRNNCRRIPSVTASVIPEPILTQEEYQDKILGRIYRDLAPHDPEGILRYEWSNARGAIARFMRNTIEIRVLDLQECPAADLAILQFVSAVLRRLTDETLSPLKRQIAPSTAMLANLLSQTVRLAGQAIVGNPVVLRAFGLPTHRHWSARSIWKHLLGQVAPPEADWVPWIELILAAGTLSERIVKAAGNQPDKQSLLRVYRQLATCLDLGVPFLPLAANKVSIKPLRPRLLLSCEHATSTIPAPYAPVARRAGKLLSTHRGYDPGALDLAQTLARTCRTRLFKGTCSRLLVELNRSLHHPQLWSEFSRPLDLEAKSRVLQTCYLPYRRAIKQEILERLDRGQVVVHVSVHTFTPELNGRTRTADIGLLFDPSQPLERRFCEQWRRQLQASEAGWKVRFNYPYRGVSDGLPTSLREEFPAAGYLGIELEVNQRLPLRTPRLWRQLQTDLANTLSAALAALTAP